MKIIVFACMVVCLLVVGFISDGYGQGYVVCPETTCFVVCPSGDLSFCYCISDAAGNPLTLPPASVFLKIVCNSGPLYVCTGETLAKAAFLRHLPCVLNPGCGAEYCWQFKLGGCCTNATISIHLNSAANPAIFTHNVTIKSPDYDGNGTVDLVDFAHFAQAIAPAPYNTCFDMNCDGIVNTIDVLPGNPGSAIFGKHYLHSCMVTIPNEPFTWGQIKALYKE